MAATHRIARGLAALGGALALVLVGLAAPAVAEPETPVVYPSGSSACRRERTRRIRGRAFPCSGF
jgi:hypothetical protein